MISRQTLVILTPGFPSDETDTTCLPPLQCFVRSINKISPELGLVIIALQYPYRNDRYKWLGNQVISMNGRRSRKITRLKLWLKIYRELKSTKANTQLLGVLSFWCLEEALIGQFFSRFNGLRHLIWINGQDARRSNPFVRWIRPYPDQLVAMSEFLAEEFEKNFSIRPLHIVTNGIEPADYSSALTEKTIDILGVGSLIPLKQYEIFIDTIGALVGESPRLKATLCGAGPQKEMLLRKVQAQGLSQNVTLTGQLPHKDVLALMQRSKILLHPSSYEGYSTVCLEALYAGCHVISFIAPEKILTKHWHIISTKEEMINQCKRILKDESDFSPVLVHSMINTATGMLKLFRYQATT